MFDKSAKLSKDQLSELSIQELKIAVSKLCWIALYQYLEGRGNFNEAKISVVTLGILVKEFQATNNSRAIFLIEEKMRKIEEKKIK